MTPASHHIDKPIHRGVLRRKLGGYYYGTLRKLLWVTKRHRFAKTKIADNLEYSYFSHQTPLLRKLKDVDMWLQHNKITNLKLATAEIDGIIIRPNEVFSYWYLIGKPIKHKGYVDGMILQEGKVVPGTGGGLCQLSNLIFWMTIHTPLQIIERHRHGYDVFPDSNRTQPFGSGATCFYPHGDLMIYNPTPYTFQIHVKVGKDNLEGSIYCEHAPEFIFKIEEREHIIQSESWGGFSRYNQLWQKQYDLDGNKLNEKMLVENSAIMMYNPFLPNNANAVKTT